MAVTEKIGPAPQYLQSLPPSTPDEGLVLYPDQISTVGDDLVAAFRPDAQALRVAAAERGISVVVAAPENAKKGIYSEHSADWVLPLIGIPTSVVASLIADYLRHRLRGWRANSSERRSPIVRYREVERSPDGSSRMREIEGPAEDVIGWLGAKDE